ncbi:hypothetical protein B9Z55_005457 [Caenorhabditis nigoni]|nr:hypothetical protein B9Z55_005457 [Caenorhabditis nigoni]
MIIFSESDASHDDAREPEKKEGKSEEVFEVEKILTHKLLEGRLFLKTRWAGFGPEEDTWEPEEDLQECANECVIEYYAKVNVKDGSELIARLQKKKSAKNHTANQKSKKRERPISSSDEDVSDNSDGSYKKKKSKKSKKSHRKSSPSASLEAPKVQTKAALKSYDSIASATSSGPSLPKQKAFLARSQYDQSSSDDEEGEPTVSFLDKIANKVKPKVTVQAPIELPVPPKSPQPETLTKPKIEVRSPSLEPTSSSSAHVSSKSNSERFELNGRNKSLTGKSTSNEDAKDWKVDGIVRHSDDLHRRKLVLLTNSTTGERKVLDPKETFDLVGWSLTKYLLDRCEF